MPNTLAHIGVHVPVFRALFRQADVRWLFMGTILPDIPWIMQRLLRLQVAPAGWADLRFYCTVQASLMGALILAAGLAVLARRSGMVFGILAGGSLMHLLLDALQIKWGNGVLLLAPFNWRPWSLNLFWPDSLPTVILTALGPVVVLLFWQQIRMPRPAPWQVTGRRLVMAAILMTVYFTVPLVWLNQVQVGGLGRAALAASPADRAGLQVAFDRDPWNPDDGTLEVFTGDRLALRGEIPLPARPGNVSVSGVLVADGSLMVERIHQHLPGFRDLAAGAGLFLVVVVWVAPSVGRTSRRRRP